MERRVVPIHIRLVSIISKYTPPSDVLPTFQSNADAETSFIDTQGKIKKNPLFRFAKCVTIPPNAEVSVTVMTSNAGLIHMFHIRIRGQIEWSNRPQE